MSIEPPITFTDIFDRLMKIADRAEKLSRPESSLGTEEIRARAAALAVAVDAIHASLDVARTFPKE